LAPETASNGLSNKEIGLALNLSEKTVKVHVTGIFGRSTS
jgi:DNA-binding NarL/FixJ family response regulator